MIKDLTPKGMPRVSEETFERKASEWRDPLVYRAILENTRDRIVEENPQIGRFLEGLLSTVPMERCSKIVEAVVSVYALMESEAETREDLKYPSNMH